MKDPGNDNLFVPDPFDRALKQIRRSLEAGDLAISAEVDVSGRIRRELGIGLPPCRILCVDSPAALLEAMALDGTAAVSLPVHVVVRGRGPQTLVHLSEQPGVQGPLVKLQSRLARALERVAIRQNSSETAAD